jgi:hypothetical protein
MKQTNLWPLALLACMPFIVSCSTLVDGSTQQVNFTTTGADNAVCEVIIGEDSFRYRIYPPQKAWVQKSSGPMTVNCSAPGNRMASKTVESKVDSTSYGNLLTLGTTYAIDGASGAMYRYPDSVDIDFTNSQTRLNPLPSYENYGAIDTKSIGIEYMGPDTPALPSDKAESERVKAAWDEAARLEAMAFEEEQERERRMNEVEGGYWGDKGKAKDSQAKESVINDADSVKAKTKPAVSAEEGATPEEPAVVIDPAAVPKQENATPAPVPNTLPPASELRNIPAQQLSKPIFPASTSF